MRTEKQIIFRIELLEKKMKKHEKTMNSKQRITDTSLLRYEEAEEMYYECFTEVNALKWVLELQ